ncbi:MAG: RluA family pseudouridine synthase [Eubacteriales bacterium]
MNIEITPEYDGMTVFDLLRKRMHISCGTLTLLKNSPTGMTVDGVRVTVRHRLRAGERLSLDLADKPETGTSQIIPKKLPLPIIYEDDDIIVADKPAGMPTHPTHGHLDDTLANALAWRAERRGEPFVFRPANRLDRNTSGIVLLAKNRLASSRLYEDMKSGRIHKTYAAITVDVPDPQCGRVDAPIARADEGILMRTVREDGSPSVTDYRTMRVSGDGAYALVALEPRTGRTHQIRVHMAHIGCPLLGDFLYGEECPDIIGRHALHAARLEFRHPVTGLTLRMASPIPADMLKVIKEKF